MWPTCINSHSCHCYHALNGWHCIQAHMPVHTLQHLKGPHFDGTTPKMHFYFGGKARNVIAWDSLPSLKQLTNLAISSSTSFLDALASLDFTLVSKSVSHSFKLRSI